MRREGPLEGGEHRRRAPPCGDTATEKKWGEGCPGQFGHLSTTDPGQLDRDSIFRASCFSWPYKFFVTRWVL